MQQNKTPETNAVIETFAIIMGPIDKKNKQTGKIKLGTFGLHKDQALPNAFLSHESELGEKF